MGINYLVKVQEIIASIETALDSKDLKKSIGEYSILRKYLLNPLVDIKTKKLAHDKGLELYARMVKLRRETELQPQKQEQVAIQKQTIKLEPAEIKQIDQAQKNISPIAARTQVFPQTKISFETDENKQTYIQTNTVNQTENAQNISSDNTFQNTFQNEPSPQRKNRIGVSVKPAIIFALSILVIIILIKGAIFLVNDYSSAKDCFATGPFECKQTSLSTPNLAGNAAENFIILKLDKTKIPIDNINIVNVSSSLRDCSYLHIDTNHSKATQNQELKIVFNCSNLNLSEILESITLGYSQNNEANYSTVIFGNSTLVKEIEKEIKKNESNDESIPPTTEQPTKIADNTSSNKPRNTTNSTSQPKTNNNNTQNNSHSTPPSGGGSGGSSGGSGGGGSSTDDDTDPAPDTTPPSLTILSPQNITYNITTITINISSDGNYTWINIGGSNITYSGNTEIMFGGSGTYTLRAYANDTAGNINSTNVTFSLNIPVNNTPVATINSPENNSYFSKNYVLLKTTVYEYDSDNTTVIIYGDAIPQNISYNITNGTTILHNWTSIADGTHNWAVTASDGNTNSTIYQTFFLIDSNAPIYLQNYTNTTEAGASATFSIMINDTIALFPNGQYIFSTNNTGTWTNDSAVNFTTTPQWANVSKTLNSTNGTKVGYRWYIKDNLSNTNNTPIYILTIINTTNIPDTTPPNLTILSPQNSSYSNSTVLINISTDGNYVWFYNGTNNETYTTPIYIEYSEGEHTIFAYANDTSGNINNTNITFYVILNTAPTTLLTAPSNNSIQNTSYVLIDFLIFDTMQNNMTVLIYGNNVPINISYNISSATRITHNWTSLINEAYNWTLSVNDGIINTTKTYYFTINITNTSDTTAPTYSQNQTNTTEAGTSATFSIYINDSTAMHPNGQYVFSTNNTGIWTNDSAVNFTTTPQWANVSKTLNSTNGTRVGYRWYIKDNLSNINNTPVYMLTTNTTTTPDNSLPYFTFIPLNATIEYGTNWTGTDFNATDNIALASYSVNDSRFTINTSGYLDDNQLLNTGSYTLNITINDTSNNTNSTTYKLTVQDTTPPSLSILSPQNTTYSNTTILINISSNGNNTWFYNGTSNETYFSATYRVFSTGTHTIYAYANDTAGNLNITNITFSIAINTAPTTVMNSPANMTYHNSTYVLLNATIYDSNLDNLTVIFYADNNLLNITYNRTNATTITYNWTSLADGTHNWTINAYDGTVNSTNTYNYLIIDSNAPIYSQNSTNTTETNSSALFSLQINDTIGLHPNGQYIFSTNNTGTWTNDSAVNFTSTPQWANVSKTLNSTNGTRIGYRWYIKDNQTNVNNTPIYMLTTNTTTNESSQNCGTLSTSGIYNLTSNISSNGTCFTITSADVTLNCQGYTITYSINGTANTYGVYSDKVNTTVKNCIILDGNQTSSQVTRPGIYYNSAAASNGRIENNFINISNSRGIQLSSAQNNTIINNTAISTSGIGIRLGSTSNNNTLINNTAASISANGIEISASNSTLMLNNTGISNSSLGIYITSSSNCNLTSNKGTSNSSIGLRVASSTNITLTNNTGLSNSASGIEIYLYANNNLLIGNNGTGGSTGNGIWIESSNGTIMYSNFGYTNGSGAGIRVDTSQNNNLTRNTGISGTNQGLYLIDSSNNNFTANTFYGEYGYYFRNAGNMNISDCIYVPSGTADVYIHPDSGSANISLINCSYNTSKEVMFNANNNLLRQWYFEINLTNSSGNPLEGANITIYNSTGSAVYSQLTNSTGNINKISITEYIGAAGGRNYSTPHTINVTLNGYYLNSTSYNLSLITNTRANITLYPNTTTPDTTPPTYLLNSTNNTIAGQSATFSIYINDSTALHPNGQYIFSTNNTGTWINDSAVNFTSTPSWANISKTLNSTVGAVVGYRWYIKDNANNSNNTIMYQLTTNTTTDTTPPTYSQNQTNTTEAGTSATFSININDSTALHPNGQYIFSTNNTGAWVNDSSVNFTTTPQWANVSKTLNATNGTKVGYRWYIKDNQNNSNNTNTFILTTTDATPPGINLTAPSDGASVSGITIVSANASDNVGVAGVQFMECAVSKTGDIASNYSYPLKASSNGHYLVDQNNKPFYIVGDSAWSLVAQLNNSDTLIYLNGRQQQGFNTILANVIEHKFASNAPNNDNNEAPFTGTKFITPNENYFAHLDFVVNESANRGIVLFLFPIYIGYDCSDEGWCAEIQNASESNMTYWGQYLGNRYNNYTNIIWVVDGDANSATYGLQNKTRAFVNGLRTYDTHSLISAHSKRGESSLDVWTNESWLTLNGVYTTNNASAYTDSKRGYQRSPAIPSFYLEGQYEHAGGITIQHLRTQAYWSSLYGSIGHFYGNCPVWSFDYDTGFCTFLNWKTELNSSGARNITYTASLFNSRQWYLLNPDFSNTIMTSGYGTFGNTDYVTGAITSNNHTYIAYLPTSRAVTVNLSKIAGTQSKVWWFNVINKATTLNGTYSNSGTQSFTPPSAGDWILVIDDAALNLSAPGTTVYPFGGCSNIDVEDTNSSYSVNWDTSLVFNGNYSLIAQARDTSGNTVNSTARYVTVNN